MSDDPRSFDRRFEYAEALENKGEYEKAIREWRLLASDQSDPEVLSRLGKAAKHLGLMDEAEKAFRTAIQLDKECITAHVNLGIILSGQHLYADAESHLRSALKYEKEASTFCILGTVLESLGRTKEAKRCFLEAIEIDPDFDEAHYNLAVNEEQSDPLVAERHLLKAIEIDPGYSEAHRELGWVLIGLGQDVRAEYHLRRNIELDGNDAWARVYLGNLLWKRADSSAAVAEFQKAIELRPDHAYPYWSLANFYESEQNWETATVLYERALEADPEDEVAHMNFGRMLLKQGDFVRARNQLEWAVSIDPDYEAARKLLRQIEQN